MPRTVIEKGRKIRTLVVDDSVVIRRLVTHALEEDPDLEVVGSAANGSIALRKIAQVNPDVVTLDVEMPEMDGITTLQRIRREFPKTVVIMFSTLTTRGATAAMDALSAGADDYVAKAANVGSLDRSMEALRSELIPKIKQFFLLEAPAAARVPKAAPVTVAPARPPVRRSVPGVKGPKKALAIGVSTGGPTALAEIFPQFPADFPVPIYLVQHMPPMFTRLLAERLNEKSRIRVSEAKEGMRVLPGQAVIAPGDFHLEVKAGPGGPVCALQQEPPENSCRPAVDVLFRSIQRVYGGAVLGVVLTGMGQDGMRGAEALKSAGAIILAQDEATSVVWGMPGAVVRAGVADAVVSLQAIVPEILRRLGG